MRISDWSSDVCSSDLRVFRAVRITAVKRHLSPHSAVEQPGIEVREAKVGGQRLGDRTLAAGGRPIDGNDHALASSLRVMKPGKLGAMGLVSSTSKATQPATHPPDKPGTTAGRERVGKS